MHSAAFLITAVTVFSFHLANAFIPRMLNGRPRGGFLRIPDNRTLTGGELQQLQELWFQQELDHFNPADTKTWKQRYYTRDAFYKPGGPIFVFIGGEEELDAHFLFHGAIADYAKKYNAYLVAVEHRFYGESHPTPDLSVGSLKYLSSEQALADLARIVSHLKDKLNGAKVMTFGGSYSGALSAWFRLKYPHLADGAVASSAPVLAKVDFKEYLEVVNDDLASTSNGAQCNQNIRLATEELASLLKTPEGRLTVKKKLKLCSADGLTNQENLDMLYLNLVGNIMEVCQYNKLTPAYNVSKICALMTNETIGSPLDRYAAINSMFEGDSNCMDYHYSDFLNSIRETSWKSRAALGSRQWVYQTCVEFAYFQTTDSKHQPFGRHIPLNFSMDWCSDIFGKAFTQAVVVNGVNSTNVNYGDRNLKVTKVVFPNGSVDPWHALGILKDINKDAPAIYIKGTAHCANMYAANANDSPGIKQAKHEISKLIGRWISE